MPTILKRGPYQWQAKIRRRGHPTQSKTFNSKADAQAWTRELESEMDRNVFHSRAEAERTTLRVLTIFDVLISTLFEVRFLFRFPHTVGESGKRNWEVGCRRSVRRDPGAQIQVASR